MNKNLFNVLLLFILFISPISYLLASTTCPECNYSSSETANYCASCGHYLKSIELSTGPSQLPINNYESPVSTHWYDYVPFLRDSINKPFFDISAWKLSIVLAICLSIFLCIKFAKSADRGFTGELDTMIWFFFAGSAVLSTVIRILLY